MNALLGRIAMEPDGSGFFAHIETYPDGKIVDVAQDFVTVEQAVEWATQRSSGILIRLSFSAEDEYALGSVSGWAGKVWPPSEEQRKTAEARARRALSVESGGSHNIEVLEPEIRRRSRKTQS